jgi:hypothetical protein
MDNNLAYADTARVTFSSEVLQFPGTNALNQRRSLIWKPGGNFTITSANNLIYINDGSDKTATLTAGNYTYSTLAAHIQTRLNVVSSSWTCTYSTTTRRFTITRTSGTAILRYSVTTTAAWSTLGYTGTVNDASKPFVSDLPVNHTDEWMKVDLVQPLAVDAFMATWPIDRAKPFSGAASIKLQFNNIDDWAAPPLEIDLTAFDRGVFRFPSDGAGGVAVDVTYRYVRFRFVDAQNPVGPEGFYLGHVYMGSYRTMVISNVAPGIDTKLVDQSNKSKAVSGVQYARLFAKFRELGGAEIQLMDADERRALQQMFSRLGTTENFYFCLDPLSEVTEDLDEATMYCRFASDASVKHVIRDVYSVNFDLEEAI